MLFLYIYIQHYLMNMKANFLASWCRAEDPNNRDFQQSLRFRREWRNCIVH
jgi:hypothetical protein